MPPASMRLWMPQQVEYHRSHIRHVDKLMRTIDGRDQVRRTAGCGRREDAIEETVLHPRPIKVRQPQHGATDLSRGICLKQQVLLLLAHLSLESMRLAGVIFA